MQIFESYVLFSVIFGIGHALECYNCDSQTNKECSKITKKSSIKPVECRPNLVGQSNQGWLKDITKIDFFETAPEVTVPMVCQKIVGADERGEQYVFRGCQIDGGKTDICDITRSKAENGRNKINIENCEVCKEDGCNKSSYVRIYSGIIFLALLLIKAIG